MSRPVQPPAGYVTQHAIAYGASGSESIAVDAANPLPVAAMFTAAGSTALAGSITSTGARGPFTPQLGRPIWLTLSGTWAGTVQVLRSVDGGVTRQPLSYPDGSVKGMFNGNVNLPVAEETVASATYYLAATIASGSLSFRMEQ